jgi:hypothetical protein
MRQFVGGVPMQGAMYHKLVTQIAATHSGLGPQNIAQQQYQPMVGKSFQKPLSAATANVPTVVTHGYR